jgi:N-acetylneuraminic acid mutarotase
MLLSSISMVHASIHHAPVASAAHATHPSVVWKEAAPSPIALFESTGAVVAGKLYVFGGFSDAQVHATLQSDVYDPHRNTWKRIADMPEGLTHVGHAVVGGNVWCVGGLVGDAALSSTADVWVYHTRTNTWTAGPALPEARGAGALVRLGSTLHFFGGLLTRAQDQGEQWVLDLHHLARGWRAAAPLPVACNHLAGVALDGRIYAIGGQHMWNEDTQNVDNVQVFNPRTDTWTQAPALPTGRGHISDSTFVYHGRIIVIGGAENGTPALSEVLEYNVARRAWSLLGNFPASRRAPVAAAVGNKLIVTTGDPGDVTPMVETWVGTVRRV